MNLSELQAFLEESGWDDEPFPAHPDDSPQDAAQHKTRRASDYNLDIESIELSSEETRRASDAARPSKPVAKERVIPELSLDEVVEDKPSRVAEPASIDEPAEDLEVELTIPAAAQAEPPIEHPKEKPVKLVPKLTNVVHSPEPELRGSDNIKDRLMEIEMAQKMGYLLCKCTWPPQIMVLTGTDHVYRCRRCSRVREM